MHPRQTVARTQIALDILNFFPSRADDVVGRHRVFTGTAGFCGVIASPPIAPVNPPNDRMNASNYRRNFGDGNGIVADIRINDTGGHLRIRPIFGFDSRNSLPYSTASALLLGPFMTAIAVLRGDTCAV